ncbi:MAG: phosphatase PAP2 family protein [Methanomicrobia archaeon]|nr:phosphatase PAP2 family protein [Methanomicrobia archaeon]
MNIRGGIKKASANFMGDKKNIIFGIFIIFIPVLYELFGFVGTEQNIIPYTLPATITNALQNFLGIKGVMAHFASYYYFYIQLLVLGGLVCVIFFTKKPWVYFLAALICFAADSVIYMFFPLAPPVRTGAADPIRLNLFPVSDYIITAKYSAFPSGHIMASFLAALICRKENFKKVEILYIMNTFIMSFVVVYLGEHYLIDAFGGILLAVFAFKVANYIGKKYMTTESRPL